MNEQDLRAKGEALRRQLVGDERFEHSGHGVFRDEPERAMRVLREFVCSETPN